MTSIAALSLLAAFSGSAQAADARNVLLVVWDTTRADHLSLYGYERATSPNLDAFAKDATVFESASPGSYWTPPSVASIFTGLYTFNHKIDTKVDGKKIVELPDGVKTLAETLKARGYRTALFNNQAVVDRTKSFARGFDVFDFKGESAIAPSSLAFMDSAGSDPWFVVAYYRGPHAPYEPAAEHNLWGAPVKGAVNIRGCNDRDDWPSTWHCWVDVNQGKVSLSKDEWGQIAALYDAEIHQHDAELKILLDGLKKRGLTDDTMVVFTSDHGEAINDHPTACAWHSQAYQSTMDVPLFIRLPGTFPGKRVSAHVSNVDLFPTIAQVAAGAPVDEASINGRNLLPVAQGKEGPRASAGNTQAAGGRAWYRNDRYKLMVSEASNEYEVYDLKADPNEQTNLAPAQPDLVATLRAEWQAYVKASTIAIAAGRDASEEDLEMLRSMGYVTE